ncbi:hypothetical protein NDU88_009613 [Pleurodeles waltl]|uniref:Uncharacterized protein n=1 Tax=Pleurodeles waltl TaxID=8319 RepID=A0AAV7RYX8_PLEWA|nr:hypothetical protein NDU88_009613 [Pleurodeles waltl]
MSQDTKKGLSFSVPQWQAELCILIQKKEPGAQLTLEQEATGEFVQAAEDSLSDLKEDSRSWVIGATEEESDNAKDGQKTWIADWITPPGHAYLPATTQESCGSVVSAMG